MLELTLTRVYETNKFTSGLLRVGNRVYCTLEDPFQTVKIAGDTRIAAGTYDLKLRERSGMADSYRRRYGDQHKGMIWLQDVPDFEYVYIHTGNNASHSEGCILIGQTMTPDSGTIGSSRAAYLKFFPGVIQAIENGPVTLTIKEEFI